MEVTDQFRDEAARQMRLPIHSYIISLRVLSVELLNKEQYGIGGLDETEWSIYRETHCHHRLQASSLLLRPWWMCGKVQWVVVVWLL